MEYNGLDVITTSEPRDRIVAWSSVTDDVKCFHAASPPSSLCAAVPDGKVHNRVRACKGVDVAGGRRGEI